MSTPVPDRFRRRVAAAAAVLVAPVALGLHALTSPGRIAVTGWMAQSASLAEPATRSTVLAGDGSVLAVFFRQDRIPVPLDQVSQSAQDAVIATEDARFYSHGAFDPVAVLRAVAANLAAGEVRQGASTLTQQYVKQTQLQEAPDGQGRRAATETTLSRKIRELGQALAVEKELGKNDILDRYLNIVYFGNGAYGIEAAAQRYFGVSAKNLTAPQAALLAGILKSPRMYDPIANPGAARERRNVVLGRMAQTGRLDPKLATAYTAEPLGLNPTTPRAGCQAAAHPFFCDYVLSEIRATPSLGATPADRLETLLDGGLTVHTTLDPQIQHAAQDAVHRSVGAEQEYGAAIVLTEPGTGAVRAIVQSREYGSAPGQTTVNWAVDAAQGGSTGFQAGSTFKPFVLAAAIEDHIDPSTLIDAPGRTTLDGFRNCDRGTDFPAYTVGNYDGRSYGQIDMRQAAARSVNTYFVQLEQRTGLCTPPALAERMGLRRADGAALSRVPSFTLGVDEVSPLRMAEAYATLAAGGEHCASYAITAIERPDGTPLPVPGQRCENVLSPQSAATVTDVLRGVIDGPDPLRTGRLMTLGATPAAGKTGTTNGAAAVWFVGYTDHLAAAVWAGYPDASRSLRDITVGDEFHDVVTGAILPGRIWADAMIGALGLPTDAVQRQADAASRIAAQQEAAPAAVASKPPSHTERAIPHATQFGDDGDEPTDMDHGHRTKQPQARDEDELDDAPGDPDTNWYW
jgi:membrane peptidoglycan carboxypeptidase